MKYPALARVFSAVLAVLGLILLAFGLRDYRKTEAEHQDRVNYETKLSGRIERYEQLHHQVETTADYKQTMTALDTLIREHEKAAAKHKTDTAVYTATKGGLQMGEELIVEAQAQLDDIRQQLKDAESRKEFLESLIASLIASQKSRMPCLDALASQAAQYAVESYIASVRVSVVIGKLKAFMELEPVPDAVPVSDEPLPEPPAAPEMPTPPELPEIQEGDDYEAVAAAWEQAMREYGETVALYEQALAVYAQDLQSYYDELARIELEKYNRESEQTVQMIYSERYRQEFEAWDKACREVKSELNCGDANYELRRLSAALASLVRQADSLVASVAAENGGVYPGMDALSELCASTSARLDRYGGADLSTLSNDEFLQVAICARDVLELLSDAFTAVSTNLSDPSRLIVELMDKLGVTEILVQYLETMLDKAEGEIQSSLELLWYQLGETEKDRLKLEAEKLGLDEEAELLGKNTMEADELKELRNQHISAQQLLLAVPEIKSGMDADTALPDSARAYLDAYREKTARHYNGRRLMDALMALAGIMGILEIPAAYELTRKRFYLLAPALLCMVFAAAADALSVSLGLGQMYMALFTAIFALLQLVIVLPQKAPAKHLK